MGQYLQMGIVYRASVSRETMNALSLREEKLLDELNKKNDMSLFDCHEHDDVIDFMLKEAIVLEQLHSFMQSQFSLYSRNDREVVEVFKEAVSAVSELSSLRELIELAEKNSFHCLQNSRIDESIKITPWNSLRLNSSMIVLFVKASYTWSNTIPS
ncbi:hypothetical protein [Paenibacillus vini]|uniref:Uncharacterized protein n=1 Tax=Paenibacillus vini TaxID=1476024 RepID=A0ABQ4MAB3_9BACL|nr:hypothetical protein [Paenibacillus vini]GIP52940.1 hypothetical protein J42TS3_19750 [Paenibacillus vini]